MLADLGVLGEDAVLVDDLFAYSSDLSVHEIVIGIAGFMPDTHIIDDTKGGALEAFILAAGLLLLEGGDCFNYDPEAFGAFNVRPMTCSIDSFWRRGFSPHRARVRLFKYRAGKP